MSLVRQVTMIGLDGATLDLIEPLATSGHLPGFSRILTSGAAGRLRSTIPALTAPAWTSFMTGQNPGKHGIFDVVVRRPDSYGVRIVCARDRRSPSLWAYLSQHGKRAAVVNLPVTYPPEPVNGILISNVDAPGSGSQFVSPAELYPEFRRAVPDYIVATHRLDLHGLAEGCRQMTDANLRAFDFVRQRERWDVQMVVFSASDMAQHVFWRAMADGDPIYRDVILDVYRSADALIARLLDELDDDGLVLVVSDHGGGPLRRAVYLNRYLQQGGFLSPPPAWLGGRAGGKGPQGREGLPHRLKAILGTAKRRLPPEMLGWLKRNFGGLRDQLESALVESLCDWERTRIFSIGVCGHLYVNLKGREPHGQVAPGADYERLLRDVTGHLFALRDPLDGGPVIEAVWRREDIYHGPALAQAPDLILQWRDSAYEARPYLGSAGSPVFEDTVWLNELDGVPLTGCHRPDGVLMAYGAAVRPGRIESASIADVAPTILHVLGLPVSADMDGRVLESLFRRVELADTRVSSAEFPRVSTTSPAGRGAAGGEAR